MLRQNTVMSSPTKQVSVRRLPPLPNQVSLRQTLRENGSVGESTSGSHNLKHSTSQVLNDLKVREYLTENPHVLEDIVMETASQEQLERWLIRKTRTSDNKALGNGVRASLSKWKFCVHTDKRKMLSQLIKDINQHPKKVKVMYELIKNIAIATHADRHSLYLVDKSGTDIYLFSEAKPRSHSLCRQVIGQEGTVAAFVAETGQLVFIKDILKDERFPKGIGIEDSTAQSVMCHPIVQSDGIIVGVVELVKSLGSSPFEKEDEEVLSSYLAWGSIAIHHAEISKQMQKQKDLNSFLLDVVRSIFDEVNTMEVVIEKIMAFAKRLVNADRCALFLVDSKTNELYANLFDEGDEDGSGYKFRNGAEIRFQMDKGIAGFVASNSEILNIRDAYKDPRFNREVDMKTGYTTHSILCVPVRCKGSTIGVVQMVNSRKGFFDSEDSQAFELFAGYCGLALHYSQMYGELFRSQQKHQVALEILTYHCRASSDEVNQWSLESQRVSPPSDFYSYGFNVYQDDDLLTKYSIQMSRDLFSECKLRVDLDVLVRFTLTLRKSYRAIPYHNWAHAFSVAHTICVILRHCENRFLPREKLALFIGGICHDIDHRGYNNAFMINSNTPLGSLYSSSTMEWHHFKQGVFLLEGDGHNIFTSLSPEAYRQLLELMQESILATDLATFFGNKAKLEEIVNSNSFSWQNEEHRSLVRKLLMTACDLCTSAKPWYIQRKSVNKVFEEFYQQGDEEKKMGLTPIPMMDREKHHELPQNQVGFLKGIVRPCYVVLTKLLPGMQPLLDYVNANLAQWEELNKPTAPESNSLQVPQEVIIKRSLSFIDY